MGLELDAPNVGELEKEYIGKTIDSGFVSTFGPYVPQFESKVSEYLDIKNAISTQSGTAALHVALHELGIGEGDEVIVPSLTFIATVNPVVYVGAKPVFVDVDLDTWNISSEEIEKNITKNTKAIIPVHLYGNPCKMDRIMDIASKNGLFVIEDATESLGALYKERHTGSYGTLGCFSFNGNKTITTGGGGMIAGSDDRRMDHIRFAVNQARDESRGYYHPEIGFNYRMTNIEASMGLAQMERLEGFLEKKNNMHKIYAEELGDISGITLQKEYEGGKSSWWFNCISFSEERDLTSLQAKLKEGGVPTRRVFMPITEFSPYKDAAKGDMKNSQFIYERGLCLPSSTLNSEDDVKVACKKIKDIL